MNIKTKLSNIEEEFNFFKSGIEKKHIYFIILYFLPPVLVLVFLSKYYSDLAENIYLKIILFVILTLGVVIHFILKNTYYRTNDKYKNFIKNKLSEIESLFSDKEEFKKSLISAAKEIFSDKNQILSNVTIKSSVFWKNVFIIIGIEIEEE